MTENLNGDSILPALTEMALDLRWSWNHYSDDLWGDLNPQLWKLTQNPWVVLQTTSRKRIDEACANPAFQQRVGELIQRKRTADAGKTWFQTAHGGAPLSRVVYFSMEFMLSEALPIYSGGLGNVAGDQLKAASDLGVPVVGVGLLYQQGYFRQDVDAHGNQMALYPFNDPGQLPIQPLRDADGEWLRIPIHLPRGTLWLRTWQAQVGRTTLYLLDTNDAGNQPLHRGIASELYGGGPETRLLQEIVLGIGGWRLVSALGLQPEVCHLNEGHAAFAVLERAFSYMMEHHQQFDVALAVTRAGNLFTTHTPVEAGFDRFSPDLMQTYLARYCESNLRIDFDELMALGRRNPQDRSEPFNMAYLAVRGSGNVNGVSRLHGTVSRRIFQVLFPRWPQAEVPVDYVTNGVHVPSWDSPAADELWTNFCGRDRWRGAMQNAECLNTASDEQLWELRMKGSQSLVACVRERLAEQRAHMGVSPELIDAARSTFSPKTLTLGFARRFAPYKRPNLLLHDPDRLIRILTNREHPVQLVLAGKAHPQDHDGQAMIKQWVDFILGRDLRGKVAFLTDYDVLLTTQLVRGVDLWLNTPRRPWEASGTSGMKVLVNGGLNLSELDGWWAEAYSPEVGWAIGDGKEHGDDPAWDAHEAGELYDLLEREVIPAFYARDERGIPTSWIAKMRASMVQLTPKYSSNRSVREYLEKYYLPAAAAYCRRTTNKSALGIEVSNWSKWIAENWSSVHFGQVAVREENNQHVFQAQVSLGRLDPDQIEVQVYAEPLADGVAFRQKMQLTPSGNAPTGYVLYKARVPATRPADDYTARVIPSYPGVSVPLEAAQILWQR